MSYDLHISVKIDKTELFTTVATPEYSSPTYNLGKLFRACTDWDFVQHDQYKCEEVLPKIEKGIYELRTRPLKYKQYEPENGWGTIGSAITALESLRQCIYETADNIPIEHLWVAWGY